MPAPVLLVADDLSLIAAVKRVLGREGYECLLATSAADAVIAFGHALPGLMLLQPSVEGDRGRVVLEELQLHPDAQLLKVVLLGETIPGFGCPVEPLPVDPPHLAATIEDNFRSSETARAWTVRETLPGEPEPRIPRIEPIVEPEDWRATPPSEHESLSAGDDIDAPEARAVGALESAALAGELEQGALPEPATVEPGVSDDEASRVEPALTDEREGASSAAYDPTSSAEPQRLDDTSLSAAHDASTPPQALPSHEDDAASGHALYDEPTSLAERHETSRGEPSANAEHTEPHTVEERIARPRKTSSPSVTALADRLFGDLPSIESEIHRDVEAEALASVESTLARQQDEELQRLEDEVRAEAQRRRVSRESRITAMPSVNESAAAPTPPTPGEPSATVTDEAAAAELSFSDLSEGDEPATTSTSPSGLFAAPASRAKEALARAEQMVLESQAVSEAQRRVDDAEQRRLQAELEALTRRSEHAEALVRRERESRESLEEQLEQLRLAQASAASALEQGQAEWHSGFEAFKAEASARAAEYERALAEAHAHIAALDEAVRGHETVNSSLREELEQRETQLHDVIRKKDEKIADLTRQREERLAELTRQQGESISALTRRHDERMSELRAEVETALTARDAALKVAATTEDLAKSLEAAQQARTQSTSAIEALQTELASLRDEHEQTRLALSHERTRSLDAEQAKQQALEAQTQLEGRLKSLEESMGSTKELVDEAALQRSALEREVSVERAALSDARAVITQQEADKAELRDELERLGTRLQAAMRELATVKDAVDQQKSRAEAAEASAVYASEKVRELEHRELMPLALPANRALGIARHGTVDLEGLARLVCQLVLGQSEVKLELGVAGGSRTLWLKKGLIVAAQSQFETESIIERARRDGLIDARQESELRMLRTATMREQLEALKTRGFIRDIEAVPLVQRCAEHLALEALSEETTQYRLNEEPCGNDVMPVTVPKPTLPLLAEALRRAIPFDALLASLGGGEAIPSATDAEWDLRSLGFSDRERKMLSWVDGEATIEDVSLASGLKPDVAFRALLVAKLFGVIELKAPREQAVVVDENLEVRRLEAKYDEVQDADYFTILGLPRSASADEVQRAHRRLSTEFDPLRFSGHSDAGLQQRAQVVFDLIEEAARALEDDRRRVEYARHLLE